jgi:hypothetical protein
MTIPPTKRVTQDRIRELFKTGGWSEILDGCTKVLCSPLNMPSGIVVFSFKDASGKYIAEVSYARNSDGELSSPVAIRLLVEGVWHHVV